MEHMTWPDAVVALAIAAAFVGFWWTLAWAAKR